MTMSVAPTALGYTGIIYATGAVILGSALVLASLACIKDMNTRTARRVFLGSLAYHPLISILMVLDTVRI